MSTQFQISYTLDVLFYIGCMIDEEKRKLYEKDIEQFMPMLGTTSDKYLEKLQKMNQGTPAFISYIVSMLIANDHLHDWTITDLLDRHKRLIVMFKKGEQFQNASSGLKKFMTSDFSKVMFLIKTLTTDLERLGFKKFWLEEKLPLLKECITGYQKVLTDFNIVAHVNGWIAGKKMPDPGPWYVLAYSGNHYELLLSEFSVVSPLTSADALFEQVVSYVLKATSYQPFCKVLKPDRLLKTEFKAHELYKSFKGIMNYADACLKKALEVYLMADCGKVHSKLTDDYPFAAEILAYFHENKKLVDMAVGDYVTEMMMKFSR